jgi:hypothetical protein
VLAVCHAPVLEAGTGTGGNSKKGGAAAKDTAQHNLTTAERQKLLEANCAGFVYVQKVDVEQQKFVFLAPCPGSFPSLHFFQGSIVWQES